MRRAIYGASGIGCARAAAAPPGEHDILDTQSSAVDGSSFTFTMPFGTAVADRVLAFAFAYRSGTAVTISSVTIGGVAATVSPEARNTTTGVSSAAIAYAEVPTGTSGNVVVTLSGSAVRCGGTLHRLTGLETTAPYLTGTGTRAATAGDMTAAIVGYRERGAMLGVAYSAAGATQRLATAHADTENEQSGITATCTTADGNTTFSNITEDVDVSMESSAAAVQAFAVGAWAFKRRAPNPVPTEILAVGRVFPPGHAGIADSNGTDTGSNSRISMYNEVGTGITKLKAHFVNGKVNATNEANGANTINFRAAVEYPAGTFTALLFSGIRDVALTAGSFSSSDELTLSIPANAQFWIRTYVTVTSGQVWPRAYAINSARGEAADTGTATSDLTTSGTITGSANAYGPFSVTATGFANNPVNRAVATLGDSITAGSGDGNYDGRGNTGWNGRASFNTLPHIAMAVGGTTAQAQVGNMTLRLGMLSRAKVTDVVVGYGVNDLTAGRTSTQVLADLQSLWNALDAEGYNVHQNTITPRSSGTWTTLGGQTALLTTHRPATNTGIRAIPAPLAGIIDMALATENASDGIWKINTAWANDSYTGDGTHPNVTDVSLREGGHFPMADAALVVFKAWVA